ASYRQHGTTLRTPLLPSARMCSRCFQPTMKSPAKGPTACPCLRSTTRASHLEAAVRKWQFLLPMCGLFSFHMMAPHDGIGQKGRVATQACLLSAVGEIVSASSRLPRLLLRGRVAPKQAGRRHYMHATHGKPRITWLLEASPTTCTAIC